MLLNEQLRMYEFRSYKAYCMRHLFSWYEYYVSIAGMNIMCQSSLKHPHLGIFTFHFMKFISNFTSNIP